MDLATVVGTVLAWVAVLAAFIMEGGRLGTLVHPSSAVLVIGGTLGATVITSPLSLSMQIPAILRNAMFAPRLDPADIIAKMVEFARTARSSGLLALEAEAKKVDNKFLQKGVELLVDGTPSETVREILDTEIAGMRERHKSGESLFSTMGGFAPTLGIIGTVMGLVHMLENLDKPGDMGPAIAAAFMATLYGVSIANLFFLPVGAKLKSRAGEEASTYEMIIEGILSIQAGDNPRIVELKMLSFLPPKEREKLKN